ncbi:26369_t:CDS:2 [Gigaspora margarita]|uniref:26369_t:CDS:1 n=1 Tax=Gigaspora margarita TaxID=4874 RepID=A0ABN7UYB6_GIGMA|nr:26369_t:CDS:2 [Gigaspora margarita]
MLEEHIESCDYNEFYDSQMIYEGNYSYIHKAKWKNGIPVVLKFSKNIENSDTLQTFEMVQKVCDHPNIIEYYAITSDPPLYVSVNINNVRLVLVLDDTNPLLSIVS